MKLRMEIPVLHAYFVWQPIEHRSKVKVIKDIKTPVWPITFKPEIVETSGWLQNVVDENTYQKYLASLNWRQIKHTIFACFLNSPSLAGYGRWFLQLVYREF